MKTKSKLYQLTGPNFQLPLLIDHNHRVITKPANDIPMVFWPDGRWCLPANIFVLELYSRGLSRKNRGGTLFTYIAELSHFLRFCHSNRIELSNVSDNHFTLFIRTLGGQKASDYSQPARSTTSVIAIGRVCLEFLACVGKLYLLDNFVGPEGRIRAEMKESEFGFKRKSHGKPKATRKYWHHHSFPQPEPQKKRLPISTKDIQKLNDAAYSVGGGTFLRKRRFIMIKLLEITGARRSEVAALSVQSVLEAYKMPRPMLKLITAKRPGGVDEYRYIPISRQDVRLLIEFIEVNRRRVIRQTCGSKEDDGRLLISQTTGKGLKPNTITQEINKLSIAGGIETKSCAHMFRHRFITKLFVALIEQHQSQNPDDHKKLLMDSEGIKEKIRQWTGHKDVNSLDTYLHLALEEFNGLNYTEKAVLHHQMFSSLRENVKHLGNELSKGSRPEEIAELLLSIFSDAEKDMDE